MTDHDCDCGVEPSEATDERTAASDGWLAERPVQSAALPDGVAENASRFFGGPIATLDDMVAAFRAVAGGDGVAVDELCHVDGETAHRAETPDETYHFRCFYDGVALAHLVDEPVEVRTETPGGDPVEMRVSPDGGVDVTPDDAVMSFGVTTAADARADGAPTPQDVYGAVCPYVKAFHGREDYERWAPTVAATTVGIPLESGVPIAAALTASESAAAD